MKEQATSGQMLETIRAQSSKFVGEPAAKMIYVVATFEVTEIRPIVDLGQGWESSI